MEQNFEQTLSILVEMLKETAEGRCAIALAGAHFQ